MEAGQATTPILWIEVHDNGRGTLDRKVEYAVRVVVPTAAEIKRFAK